MVRMTGLGQGRGVPGGRPGPARRPPQRLPLDYGIPLAERAHKLLGARLAEHPQLGFLLDGRPVSALRLRALVEAAGGGAGG